MESLTFTILGEPASKANSRQSVTLKRRGRPPRKAYIKSKKALGYVELFKAQCPHRGTLLDGDLAVTMTIYYATRRPDLDESLILDLMQKRIYKNDRQVREKHVYWELDRKNPRAEISVRER